MLTVDPAALADWNAANRRARAEYYRDPMAASRLGGGKDSPLRDVGVTTAVVRRWAIEAGYPVHKGGQVPYHVIEDYLDAHTRGATNA